MRVTREDFYTDEHYANPVYYEALKNIAKKEREENYMPIVYICSPYSGDVEYNVAFARRCCSFAVKTKRIPIAPHLLYPQFMDDTNPNERRLGTLFGRILINHCKELWVCGDIVSPGMKREIRKAIHRQMPIRTFTEDGGQLVPDKRNVYQLAFEEI